MYCLSDNGMVLRDSREVMTGEMLIGHVETYAKLLNIITLKL